MVSNANRWEELAKEISAAEAERLEHLRRDRQARLEREQLWHWSQTHAGDVMAEVAAAAVRRAEELAVRTGVRLSVRGPEHCVMTKPTAAQVWVVRIAGRERQIVVYAYASPGGLPLVHYLLDGDVGFVKASKRQRLVSFPGCRIAPDPRGDHTLRRLGRDGTTEPGADLELDDIVFRAFELLLRREGMRRAARASLPEPETVEAPPLSRRPTLFVNE